MLSGDYLTFKKRSQQSKNISPLCKICNFEEEDTCHVLTAHISENREKILQEMENVCSLAKSEINFIQIRSDKLTLAQFILDPSSINLQHRIYMSDPVLPTLFKKSRQYCYITDKERVKALQYLS